MLWTGASVQQFALAAGQTHRLMLNARVASPGVYEVNSLCLKAAVSTPSPTFSHQLSNNSDIDVDVNGGSGQKKHVDTIVLSPANTSPSFVRQLCDFSSLVVVMAAS